MGQVVGGVTWQLGLEPSDLTNEDISDRLVDNMEVK